MILRRNLTWSIVRSCISFLKDISLRAKRSGTRSLVGAIVFSTSRPDRLWGPSSPLFSGYQRAASPGLKRLRLKCPHLQRVYRLRMREAIPPFPLHAFMVCKGTTLICNAVNPYNTHLFNFKRQADTASNSY
jgi:hypothetical protein